MYEKNRQELLELAKNLLEREEEPELPVISQVNEFFFVELTLIIKIDYSNLTLFNFSGH